MVNCNPTDYGYIVKWQANLVNTKETVLPVCKIPYHTNKRIKHKWEEIWKNALNEILK